MDTSLAQALGEIQRSLGSIETKVDGTLTWMQQHVADDKAAFKELDDKVDTLRITAAKQKGFISALSVVSAAISAGIGYLLERLIMGAR